MNYFKQCTNLDEVKKLYKELAKMHHPDKGGSMETMQEINNQYHKACVLIAKNGGMTDSEAEAEILQAEAYREAINKVIHLNGLIIEVVGAWIWITGETKQHKETLKEAKFMFASKKIAWYFRTAEHKVRSKKNVSLDEIRTKYGSQVLAGTKYKSLNHA